MNWFFCERHDRPTNWGHMFRIEREADGARFPLARVVMNRMLNLIDSNTMDVVFSAEDLFFLDDAEIAYFCDAMRSRFSDIIVLAYVRRQDLMTLSQWAQGGKTVQCALIFGGLKGPLENINPYMLKYLDYAGRLEVWKAALPNCDMRIRIYDRDLFPNRDVICDFIDASGLDLKPDGYEGDVNSTMGAKTVRFVYLLRAAGILQGPIKNALNNGRIPVTSDRVMPSAAEARDFVSMFAESNKRLAQMMGKQSVFSDDFSSYPDTAVMPPLDPNYVQEALLSLLVDALGKIDPRDVLTSAQQH